MFFAAFRCTTEIIKSQLRLLITNSEGVQARVNNATQKNSNFMHESIKNLAKCHCMQTCSAVAEEVSEVEKKKIAKSDKVLRLRTHIKPETAKKKEKRNCKPSEHCDAMDSKEKQVAQMRWDEEEGEAFEANKARISRDQKSKLSLERDSRAKPSEAQGSDIEKQIKNE